MSDLFAGLNVALSGGSPALPEAPKVPTKQQDPTNGAAAQGTGTSSSAVGNGNGAMAPPKITDPVSAPVAVPAPAPVERVTSAPVTDKLLGLFGMGPTSAPARSEPAVPLTPHTPVAAAASKMPIQVQVPVQVTPPASPSRSTFAAGVKPPAAASVSPQTSFPPAKPSASPPKKRTTTSSRPDNHKQGNGAIAKTSPSAKSAKDSVDEEDIMAAFSTTPPPSIPTKSIKELVDEEDIMAAFSMEPEPPQIPKLLAATKKTETNPATPSSSTLALPTPQQQSVEPPPTLHGAGVVHFDTPIPNSDVALRIFRKFAKKTRPQVPGSHGGSQKLSIIRFLFGNSIEWERKFLPYKELIELILTTDEDGSRSAAEEEEEKEDVDRIVESMMGQSGDTMQKARVAVAGFCHLLSVWGHASAHMAEVDKGSRSHKIFAEMLAAALDTATALVTHGCLDGVMIGIGPNHDEYHKAVDILAESVFCSDLSLDANELAAMKFLLSTGCRVTPNGHAMLRGTHLLQAIRVLYHVYLTTSKDANKTSARASLQQLVTSVFIRMIAASNDSHDDGGIPHGYSMPEDSEIGDNGGKDPAFPSDNHRDAFLVLRSLCKLSMRNPPTDPKMHSHVGLGASGSNPMWDGSHSVKTERVGGDQDGEKSESAREQQAHLVYTQAIHPALASKVLALDLLLYVLENTELKGSFLHQCGPQFHYAIRNYLCVSILKNCTSDDTRVVNLSLRVFVPIIRNFRSILKTEIEAFVTNVFFVILDSKNSPIEHKSLVVTLFEEICSDPTTLADIFLNYDCDLSAVDLFHRIVNSLSKVSRSSEIDDSRASSSTMSLVAGSGGARMERMRTEHRELRLEAMRALRQVLASLHASIVEPMPGSNGAGRDQSQGNLKTAEPADSGPVSPMPEKKTLVQIYDSKKKRREEESEAVLRFNQKPAAGISYAAKCGHFDGSDPADVARYLLKNKETFNKTSIGEYLGREPEYQNGFSFKVLHEYVHVMDFEGLSFDDAIRFYLSGFRLPGEAQKVSFTSAVENAGGLQVTNTLLLLCGPTD
jgi:hypothetical protein